MTAIATRPSPQTRSDPALLRFALRADATVCGGFGLFVAMAADPISRLSGLTATAEWISGAALVAYGVLLYSVARLRDIRRVGAAVLIGNVAFTAAVTVVLVAGWLPLTEFGTASVVAFTVATAGLACLQYLGLRHLA